MSLKASAITRDRYLTGAELVKLYLWIGRHESTPSWQDPCFLVRFVLGSGLRVSEVPVLRIPEDCGIDGMIHVRRSKTGLGRMVKLTPELMPYYLHRLSTVTGPMLFSREVVNGRAYSEPFTTKTLGRWWKDVLTAAGVRPIPIHGGRHTYATHELGSRRLQAYEVQMQLGHASVDMTLAFYCHCIQEYLYENNEPPWRLIALGNDYAHKTILRIVGG